MSETNNSQFQESIYKENHFHELADEILQRMFEGNNAEKREFIQKLLKEYTDLAETKKGKYTQDWTAYNKAQSKEKIALINILDELLTYIPADEKKKVGRKPVNLRDKIFYLVLQSYNIKSSRRCISDLELCKRLNYIEKTPHFNTILKCLKDPSLVPYFKYLIQMSGLPLQQLEKSFAVDSSGFSTSQFGRWLDIRTGSDSEKRKYVKAHLTCGVITNIITAVNITRGDYNDSPQFAPLVKETSKVYEIKEVSADKAYSSKLNLQTVDELGGIPFIPFKSNATGNTHGFSIWRKMFKFFTDFPNEFYHHYHKRSNVETCFHMIKTKFGSHLRSKSEIGQTNEILAKCLCHNLCVLVQEALELGIEIDFNKCANYEIAHK